MIFVRTTRQLSGTRAIIPCRLGRLLVGCGAAALQLSCSGIIEPPSPRITIEPDIDNSNGNGQDSESVPEGNSPLPLDSPIDLGQSLESFDSNLSDACVGQSYKSQRLPVDLYFLVDTSGSMDERISGGSKWEFVSESLVRFLERPENVEFGFGLGYFPAPPPADCFEGDPGCECFFEFGLCLPDPGGSCFVRDYSRPAVRLSLPPATAPLVNSLVARRRSGDTPTRPALEGAVSVVSAWASLHPDRRTAIVMATDGEPQRCTDNKTEDVVRVAADALAGTHEIRTFVLGVGASLTSLNAIAEAGGTKRAFLADTGGNLLEQLDTALESIRNETVCDFAIPEQNGARIVDPERVNVLLTPTPNGPSSIVGRTVGGLAAACGPGGGWYYDEPNDPRSIRLCEETCQQAADAVVNVEFGCSTVVNIR